MPITVGPTRLFVLPGLNKCSDEFSPRTLHVGQRADSTRSLPPSRPPNRTTVPERSAFSGIKTSEELENVRHGVRWVCLFADPPGIFCTIRQDERKTITSCDG
eukprot:scaffold257978_cov30-Tisochrysis_lutea.AAC.1